MSSPTRGPHPRVSGISAAQAGEGLPSERRRDGRSATSARHPRSHDVRGRVQEASDVAHRAVGCRRIEGEAFGSVRGVEKVGAGSSAFMAPSTTALSPYMKFGCVSPRTFYHELKAVLNGPELKGKHSKPPESLEGQLLWREFYYLSAAGTPNFDKMEGNRICRQIPWTWDEERLAAWEEGRTGFPWIDACMAQLKKEGWMHHLARHAVACFLTQATFSCTGKPARRFLTASSWTRTGPSTTETGCGCRARASSISISACTGRCRSVRSTIKTVTSSDITFRNCATCGKVHLRAVARAAGRAEESRVRRWGGLPRANRGPCGGIQRVHR